MISAHSTNGGRLACGEQFPLDLPVKVFLTAFFCQLLFFVLGNCVQSYLKQRNGSETSQIVMKGVEFRKPTILSTMLRRIGLSREWVKLLEIPSRAEGDIGPDERDPFRSSIKV